MSPFLICLSSVLRWLRATLLPSSHQCLKQMGELGLWSKDWESCPQHPLDATLRRVASSPCQGKAVKLTLLAQVCVNQLQNLEYGEMSSYPSACCIHRCLRQVWELVLRPQEWAIYAWPPATATLRRASPAHRVGNTTEPTLLVEV